jgi:GntR family transcriptional regulator
MTVRSPSLPIGPISPAAPGPLYQQIIAAITREVASGRLAPGHPLPSFRALAEELQVSLITVKRAYEELERERVIYRRQGLGTFIAENGGAAAREAQRALARQAIRHAVALGREGGLADDEIVHLLREECRGKEGARR